MRLVIVTGMSGAGKSTAMKMMEDMGYFCVDNLPIMFFEKFVEFAKGVHGSQKNIALGMDVRSGDNLKALKDIFDKMDEDEVSFEVLFLDSSDEVLIKRYKETRRNHPLAGNERIEKGLELERKETAFLKKRADYIIDTSTLLTRELKTELDQLASLD